MVRSINTGCKTAESGRNTTHINISVRKLGCRMKIITDN